MYLRKTFHKFLFLIFKKSTSLRQETAAPLILNEMMLPLPHIPILTILDLFLINLIVIFNSKLIFPKLHLQASGGRAFTELCSVSGLSKFLI